MYGRILDGKKGGKERKQLKRRIKKEKRVREKEERMKRERGDRKASDFKRRKLLTHSIYWRVIIRIDLKRRL
jgi:hypothetical protein